ncbi:hypothetical protein [Chryseobacterium sp. RU37D]|nr:hypothetical protein [Chryseobacterium sp. RU37D]
MNQFRGSYSLMKGITSPKQQQNFCVENFALASGKTYSEVICRFGYALCA